MSLRLRNMESNLWLWTLHVLCYCHSVGVKALDRAATRVLLNYDLAGDE